MLNSWKSDSDATSSNEPEEIKPINRQTITPARPSTSLTGAGQKSQSIVDECLTMKGDLESDADILVKGKVFGNINCNILIVDMNAQVEGGVDAREVIVRGKVTGIIKADRVRLEGTANVECDIYQKIFSAEEGARILGSLKNMDELVEETSAPQPSKQDQPARQEQPSRSEKSFLNASLKNPSPRDV